MNILLVDHYDSFSYNLFHLLKKQGADVIMKKCDDPFLKDFNVELFDGIVLSPGPGTVLKREDIGLSQQVVERCVGKIPILGVCLGHQLLVKIAGAKIIPCAPAHGKKDSIKITDSSGIFKGFKNEILGMRYHSFCIDPATVPKGIVVTAETSDGVVMGIADPKQHWYGTQFHPESIGTPDGDVLAKNFLDICSTLR